MQPVCGSLRPMQHLHWLLRPSWSTSGGLHPMRCPPGLQHPQPSSSASAFSRYLCSSVTNLFRHPCLLPCPPPCLAACDLPAVLLVCGAEGWFSRASVLSSACMSARARLSSQSSASSIDLAQTPFLTASAPVRFGSQARIQVSHVHRLAGMGG